MALAVQLVGVRLRALTLKNGMTTKTTWGDPYDKWFITYWVQSLDVQKEFGFFSSLVIMQSVTADGSLRSPTGGCRGITSYTSYSRTNDCTYNGYDNINLEPNAMNNKNTFTHMDAHNHAVLSTPARRPLMRTVHIALWLKSALHASSHPCMCTCALRCGCFLFISPVFYFVPPFSFPALPDVHLRVQREVQGPTPCATSAWGPLPLLTTRHPSH